MFATHSTVHGSSVTGLRDEFARFDVATARELLEFAVDLDAQDDRLRMGVDARFEASGGLRLRPSSGGEAPAESYWPQYHDRWQMLVDTRLQYADGVKRSTDREPSWDGDDPSRNGFGPFANAWILARGKQANVASDGEDLPTYVVAIRGTVFSSAPSVVEDLFANTIVASHLAKDSFGTPLRLAFAQTPGAEIHAGFAYACLSTLFDRQFGLVRALEVIPESRLNVLLTGHSQGAAMATLLHAFFRYAIADNRLLKGKTIVLGSYVFAQPKPGNALFAADFDRMHERDGGSFTVNNSLDPVPALPLTRQALDDLSRELPRASWIDKLINAIDRPARMARRWFSSKLDREIVNFVGSEDLLLDPTRQAFLRAKACAFAPGWSRNFAPAGTPVWLTGDPDVSDGPNGGSDPFVQHHATTYRTLLGRDELHVRSHK